MYNPDEECKAMVVALKKLCEQKGMSPHALAKEAGISTSTISYLMKGKTRPQVYTVLELCNVLGVSINELFSRPDTYVTAETGIQYITCDEKNLLDCYRGLSDKKKELLRIYVDMLRQYKGIIVED